MSNKPNIIFLMADTMTRLGLNCYQPTFIKTPNIEAFSKTSSRFEHLYQPANMCMPSRCSWWTGLYPSGHKVYRNGDPMDRKNATLFKSLKSLDYYGGYLGLYHCWPGPDRDGLNDWTWIDYMSDVPANSQEERQRIYNEICKENDFYPSWHDLKDFENGAGYTDYPIEKHLCHRITEKALGCIEDFQSDRPNALWVSYWMPHEPFAPPKPYDELYSLDDVTLPGNVFDEKASRPSHHREAHMNTWAEHVGNERNLRRVWAAYGGMMTWVDECMGRIIDTLKAKGLFDDAIVVISTDHGTTLGAHGWWGKGMSYMMDEISRIPCLFKLPGQSEAKVIEDLVATADFTPTILEHLELSHDGLHGESWQKLFAGEKRECDYVLAQHGNGQDDEAASVRMLRTGQWKYNQYSSKDLCELYDMQSDPMEMHNLAAENEHVCADLKARLKEILESQADDFEVARF